VNRKPPVADALVPATRSVTDSDTPDSPAWTAGVAVSGVSAA
jgi:hypothetical protein